jgi:hypothetical protein
MFKNTTIEYVESSKSLTQIQDAITSARACLKQLQPESFEAQKMQRGLRWLFSARSCFTKARDEQVLL